MEMKSVNPESPGISPVQLSDCLEQLLMFVLQSSIDDTLGFDLGLSTDFCAALLKKDDDLQYQTPSISSWFSEGLPLYPLYKCLASALHQWITSGSFISVFETVPPMSEDDSLKELKDNWDELVSLKGSELMSLLNSISFELHVQEPYFTQLKDGLKTVEGRCAVGNYNRIQPGDLVFFNKCLMLEVQDVHRHASFSEMLEAESLEKVLPGVLTIEEGCATFYCEVAFIRYNARRSFHSGSAGAYVVNIGIRLHTSAPLTPLFAGAIEALGERIYRKFYPKEKEQLNGVLAICVRKPASQPHRVLSDIIVGQSGYIWHPLNPPLAGAFQGLGYRGIQSLLGLKHTVGTIPEALPPTRSTLLTSFTLPQKPNVKGCSLTDGARALSKHVNRCCSQYWGKLEGNDSTKNQHAMKVITHIMDHCKWLNVHIVRPHGAVFEIRILEGYGARWSKDGTKFIGFLEPYMEDGHSKKWRH